MGHWRFVCQSLRLLRQHKPWRLLLIFLLTLFFGVSSGFSMMLLIPLLQLLTGSGAAEGSSAMFFSELAQKTGIPLTIESILIIYVVILTLNALVQYWKSVLDARYQQSLIYSLRRRLFRKILLAEWHELNSRSRTSHLQVLTKEVPVVAEYLYYLLRLFTSLIITVSYVIYAVAVSPLFTAMIIVAGLVLFVVLRHSLSRAFSLGSDYNMSYSRLLKYIDDFWQTVKIAKVHSSERFYYDRFDEANASLLDLETRMQRNWSLPQLIYRIAGIVVLVVIIYLGYHSGRVPLTSFFVLILLFSRIYPRFVEMNTDLNAIVSNAASVKLVVDLDSEYAGGEFSNAGAGDADSVIREIKLENIRFGYEEGSMLFEEFSAVIPACSLTGIIGESGIGKTTLIDIIAGLQKPEAGRIIVNGRELTEERLPSWRSSIGYLPQDPFFIDGTLRENLLWDSSDVTDGEIMESLRQVNAVHLVTRYESGLDTYIVNYQHTFSGGECQRLALARVLLRRPRLLLLDEATSSLDAENENTVLEVLGRLKKNITIVFVTHRIALTDRFDRVIRL